MHSSTLYWAPKAREASSNLHRRPYKTYKILANPLPLPSQHDPGMNPSFKPSPHPKMPDIQVSSNGIEKLLKGLNAIADKCMFHNLFKHKEWSLKIVGRSLNSYMSLGNLAEVILSYLIFHFDHCMLFWLQLHVQYQRGDRGSESPLKNHKAIGFLSNMFSWWADDGRL